MMKVYFFFLLNFFTLKSGLVTGEVIGDISVILQSKKDICQNRVMDLWNPHFENFNRPKLIPDF